MPEDHALEKALAHLGEVAGRLLVAYRSLEDTAAASNRDHVHQGEVQQAVAGLLAGVTRTVLVVAGLPDPLGLLPPGTALAEAAVAGASVRMLGPDKLRADRAAGLPLRALARGGVQIATAPVIPPAIVIADGRTALMELAAPCEEDAASAFFVRDPRLVAYLAAAIDCFWAMALPLSDLSEAAEGGLSPVDQSLLRLLAQGKTQQEVARMLHLSVRTVSRRIADLKQELKADSPLQAGMEAVRRGWL